MSTASEGTPIDPASLPHRQPSALALLTATALGGVVASRLPNAPLVLAAGAAALALLKPNKAAPAPVPRPVALPPVEEPPAAGPLPRDKVQQWLDQQIHRETQSEIIELPAPDTPLPPPEEAYTPPAFLLDDDEAVSAPLHPDFARLTEPVPRPVPLAPVVATREPDLPALQALEATESCPTAASGWLLGIDPFPSIGDSPAPPLFTAPVFEGGALPDEIEVPQPADPEPLVHLIPSVPETAAEIESPGLQNSTAVPEDQSAGPVQEIEVQLAAPGEASFDPPLAESTHNPWQPPAELMKSQRHEVASMPMQVSTPVVDAEIVLRPRAPVQTSVVAKSQPSPLRVAPVSPQPSSSVDETAAAASASPSLPAAPVVIPREQRARPTWSSWWRGE